MCLKCVLGTQEPLKKIHDLFFFFYSIEKLHVSDTQCISDTLWPIHVSFFEVPGQKSKKKLMAGQPLFHVKNKGALVLYTLSSLLSDYIAHRKCQMSLTFEIT